MPSKDFTARRNPAIAGCTATGVLKILALVFMFIDHAGKMLFPQIAEMRMLGRIAFPLYCWCMVVGISYTRSVPKYLGRQQRRRNPPVRAGCHAADLLRRRRGDFAVAAAANDGNLGAAADAAAHQPAGENAALGRLCPLSAASGGADCAGSRVCPAHSHGKPHQRLECVCILILTR